MVSFVNYINSMWKDRFGPLSTIVIQTRFARLRWISNWFPISQGVRQGGVLSTFLYLVFINDLLQELQNQNPNTGIHSIRSSNPALADDISCIALSPRGLQTLLNTAYDFSTRWRFRFNASKSNVLYFSPTGINNNSLSWNLGHDTIKISKSYNHLGILLDAKLDPTERTAKACRKGQQTHFALKISEHLNPATLSKLYKGLFFLVFCMVVSYGVTLNRRTTALWTYFSTSNVNTPRIFQNIQDQTCASLWTFTSSLRNWQT